jgi:hypothetical protein
VCPVELRDEQLREALLGLSPVAERGLSITPDSDDDPFA